MKTVPMTPALYQYMLDVSLREHPVLEALRRKTAPMALASMQVAPDQAQFLQFVIKLTGAERILELGTFTGYSALAMALALPDTGRLITCDINEEWTRIAHPFWEQAQVAHKIDLRLAPALQSLAHILEEGGTEQFDLIFIDADKTNYMKYYEYALQLIKPRGLIAVDNIFWDGTVLDESDTGAQKREINRLNKFIKQDQRVEISLLTIADGLFLIQKR